MTMGKAIQQLESLFLFVIALPTVVGAVKEIYLILGKRDVGLQDLLLMFLYVEVLGMVGIYLDSKQIPITLPIFIAITALARMAACATHLRSGLYSDARDRCVRCQISGRATLPFA